MMAWFISAFILFFYVSCTLAFIRSRPKWKSSVLRTHSQTESSSTIASPSIWQEYQHLMNDVMNRDRVITKKAQNLQPVQEYLLSNTCLLEPPEIVVDESFRHTVKLHHQAFLNLTNFNKAQFDYCQRCLVYFGDWCAKKQLPDAAAIAWYKLRESGTLPRENCVSTFMYVLGLSNEVEQVANFHDALYEPNEKTITLRIKALVQKNQPRQAEDLLATLPDKGKSSEWKRLRTFLPILSHYCDTLDLTSALRLFRSMRQSDGVFFDADTYAILLEAMAKAKVFYDDAEPIPEIETFGFESTKGPRLLDQILTEMSDDLLEIDEVAAIRVFNAFAGVEDDEIRETKMYEDRILVGRTKVNEKTAVCPDTGARLRLFTLTEEQRCRVHDTLLVMAVAQHEEFGEKLRQKGKGRDRMGSEYAHEKLLEFSQWMSGRHGPPFTAIVDGANVAYYGHGDVHYSQVQLIVKKLEEIGETPVVIMPKKYTSPSFWLQSLGKFQQLKERDLAVLEELEREGKFYCVPANCLDDYYWMLASVANQTEADLVVPSHDNQGRFPGMRPILVTNDQMRDHKLSLLEPRLFRRWTSSHIVNYDLKPYENEEWEPREVELMPADFFSREIQGNAGQKFSQSSSATAWHIPVTEWTDHGDRLCLLVLK